jgi:hypothetical protein
MLQIVISCEVSRLSKSIDGCLVLHIIYRNIVTVVFIQLRECKSHSFLWIRLLWMRFANGDRLLYSVALKPAFGGIN